MELIFSIAETTDVPALVALQNRVNEDLSFRYPGGPWKPDASERGVLFSMRHAKVLLARHGSEIAGKLRLHTKKPWAIDIAYFTPVKKVIYLTGMAVDPAFQGKGVGSAMLAEAVQLGREWPADAIRLDAYDRPGGAGGLYARNGFAHRGRAVYRNNPLIYFEMVFAPLADRKAHE